MVGSLKFFRLEEMLVGWVFNTVLLEWRRIAVAEPSVLALGLIEIDHILLDIVIHLFFYTKSRHYIVSNNTYSDVKYD